jgi:hypothetical protein
VAAGEDASAGTAHTRADLVAFLQAAAATAELCGTVAALESQVHSDEIAAHSLNAGIVRQGRGDCEAGSVADNGRGRIGRCPSAFSIN